MSSSHRARNLNSTHLKAFHKNGEVELITTDKDVIERATMASRSPESLATFVYFDGEEDEMVTGRVIAILGNWPRFCFSVFPEVDRSF
jgi:hypothetical protein